MTDKTSRTRCAYSATGQPPDRAPTIVFVHSLGADRGMWRPQLQALATRYHLVALDLRGHGRSAVPRGPYALSDLRDDVLEVADELALERFHYCGISIGGLVGLALALHAPQRLLSLTASNTAARIGSEQSWHDRVEAVRSEGMAELCSKVVPRWFGPRFAREEPALYAAIEQTFRSTSAEGYSACCAALQAADLREHVARIRVPTWIAAGELDVSTPPEHSRFLHANIAGSTLTVFPDAAHLSNLDCAPAFTESLTRFVTSHAQ